MIENKPIFKKFNQIQASYSQDDSSSDNFSHENNDENSTKFEIQQEGHLNPYSSTQTHIIFQNITQIQEEQGELCFTDKKTITRSQRRRNRKQVNKENEKQNISSFNQLQNDNCSIKQIKLANTGVSCSDFIFCPFIPSLHTKITREISINELEEFGDSFDILLFRNKNTLSKIQRFMTSSQYDHVAMLVKLGQSKFLLQSTGASGVTICNFSNFISGIKKKIHYGASKLGYELAYRKIRKNGLPGRAEIAKHRLTSFLNKVLGKKYKFSPLYLLTQEYQKEQQTYFCSELLAECIKYCYDVDLGQPSFQILPGHFGEKTSSTDPDDTIKNSWKIIMNTLYERLKKVNTREIL